MLRTSFSLKNEKHQNKLRYLPKFQKGSSSTRLYPYSRFCYTEAKMKPKPQTASGATNLDEEDAHVVLVSPHMNSYSGRASLPLKCRKNSDLTGTTAA